MLVLSLLMVSKMRYYSFKDFDIRRRQPHLTILFLALLIVTVFTRPQAMLLIIASTYLVSGFVLKISSLVRVPKVPAAEQADPKET